MSRVPLVKYNKMASRVHSPSVVFCINVSSCWATLSGGCLMVKCCRLSGITAECKLFSPSRCRNPMVTGTSVLGVKFTGGVIIAADMLGSYGSLARFRNISRLMKVTVAADRTASAVWVNKRAVLTVSDPFQVNGNTILGASGDYADYQYLKQIIEQMV